MANNTYKISEIPDDKFLPAVSVIKGTTSWDADKTYEHFKDIFTDIGCT